MASSTDGCTASIGPGAWWMMYLRDVLGRIADHKINRIHERLPWNWATVADIAAAA